jgi:hypothetical protein
MGTGNKMAFVYDSVSREAGESMAVFSPKPVFPQRNSSLVSSAGQKDQSIRLGIWEWTEQNSIHHRKHRRYCPDSNREREDDQHGKPRILVQGAHRIVQIGL